MGRPLQKPSMTAQKNTILPTYSWRPIHRNDISAIREMTAAAVGVDKSEGPAIEESLNQIFQILGERLETNSLAGIAAGGSLAAIAFILTRPGENEFLVMIDGHIHVDHRGKGLGSYILDWLENRAREEYEKSDQDVSLVIRTSCADHLQDRINLFEENRFEASRYSYKMQRDLSLPIPDQPLPSSLQLERWTKELDQPMMVAFNEAFHGQWGLPEMDEQLWEQFFTGVPQFRGDLTYLAMEGETIAGFCLNWVDQAKNEQSGVQEGFIEAIGVIPEWRGHGVASALLVYTMKEFHAEGMERAALDVDTQNPTGALRLYEKLGFEAVKRTITFTKEVLPIG
jgi:ribosomal protein S18 acetylase RimI-like enzyme